MTLLLIAALAFAAPGPNALERAADRWTDCVRASTERFAASTSEPAQTVVTAAMGACGREEAAAKAAWIEAYGAADSEESVAELRRFMRELATARVLQMRTAPPQSR